MLNSFANRLALSSLKSHSRKNTLPPISSTKESSACMLHCSYGYGTLSLLTNSYKWYKIQTKEKEEQQPLCSQFVWILKSSLSEVYQNPTSIKSWGPRCLKVNLRTNRSIHICFFHFRKQIKPQNKSLLKKK